MSTLSTEILQEADGIYNETRVCSITEKRLGSLFTKIGTELNTKETIEGVTAKVATAKSEALQYTDTNVSQARTEAQQYTNAKVADLVGSSPAALDTLNELASALGKDPNFATTVTTKLSEKADRTETVLEGGEIAEDPYADTTTPCSRIVFNATQAVSNRGAVAQFCTANQGVALQAHADSDRFFVARLEKDNMGAADRPRPQTWHWNKVELWHRGNLDMHNYMEVARAGRVHNSGSYEAYKGAIVKTERLTTGICRITHNVGTSSNMIVITPLGDVAKSFAVTKYANYCDIKSDSMTDFEIQVLKY